MLLSRNKLYATTGLALLFLFVFVVKNFFSEGLYVDEHHYFPTVIQFSKELIPSIGLLKDYDELNTPLPFILGGWVIRIFGENIFPLRMLTFLTSFSLLMVFVWFSPDPTKRLYLCLAGLLIFPSYYLCSIYYHTDIYAMIFVLGGLAAYLYKRHYLAALLFVLGICSRQYMLAFPAAIIFYEFAQSWYPTRTLRGFAKKITLQKTWVFYLVACLSIIPWFLLWGGMAPATVMENQYYDSDKLVKFNFGYALYVSAIIACYYVLPETLFRSNWRHFLQFPKNNPVRFSVFLGIAIFLVAFFPARQANNPFFNWPYLGYVDHLMELIGLSGLLKQALFGLLMLITLIRFFPARITLPGAIVLFNVLLLGKAQLSWDKYSLPMMMCLWFLAMFDPEWSGYSANSRTTGQDHTSQYNKSPGIHPSS